MLKIVLVRHGYSLGNKEQTLSGWKDVPLVKEGIEELNELKAAYHYPETESYFSSDLSRAYETAKILFPGREVLELAAFREMNFGIYEGKDEKQVDYHAFFGGWFAGAPIEGGENYFQFRNRVMKAIEALCWEMVESGKESTTLVSHSGVIRVLFSQCYKTGRDGFLRFPYRMDWGISCMPTMRRVN